MVLAVFGRWGGEGVILGRPRHPPHPRAQSPTRTGPPPARTARSASPSSSDGTPSAGAACKTSAALSSLDYCVSTRVMMD